MKERILRSLKMMEFEEKLFHVGVLLTMLSLFVPWLSIGTFAATRTWGSAFDVHVGFIGHTIFLLCVGLLWITSALMFHWHTPFILRHRCSLRLIGSLLNSLSVFFIASILFRMTSEVPGTDIRFGLTVGAAGSFIASLYSFLLYQQHQARHILGSFQHPDERQDQAVPLSSVVTPLDAPPPPLPTPPPMEHHHLTSHS